ITDTPENQRLAQQYIAEFDVGEEQISIEARFIEIGLTDLSSLGVEWDTEYRKIKGKSDVFIGSGPMSSPGGGTNPVKTGTDFDVPIGGPGLSLAISKTTLNGNQLSMFLHSVEKTGKANVLSSPKITTLSGQIATIQVVRTVPYATAVTRTNIAQGSDAADNPIFVDTFTIAEKTVGIKLPVKPTVGEDKETITLEVSPEVSQIVDQVPIVSTAGSALGLPVIDARAAQTTVVVKSGETIILGGLVKDNDSDTTRQVPLLGNIPIVGNLFKFKSKSREKGNLIILITATLVTAEGLEQAEAR
ncbi:MAG: hypothetical protein HYY56_02195, partial [Candidatus Omnitrophica bacterium]|nr:hypothetical protein [Candidatus Omnitrophota bacterium]